MGPDGQRQMEIQRYKDQLAADLEHLETAISTLLARLEPVQRPEDPRNEKAVEDEKGPTTPLGAALSGSVDHVRRLRDRVSDALQRLEL